MALNQIATNTDLMTSDINSLTDELKGARGQLDKMFTEITELDTMWDGPANEEFVRQFAADKTACEELFKTIDSIIECMTYAKNEYVKCDNEIGSIIGAI